MPQLRRLTIFAWFRQCILEMSGANMVEKEDGEPRLPWFSLQPLSCTWAYFPGR